MSNSVMRKCFFTLCILYSATAFSQKTALKNNLVYDAIRTPNLSLEIAAGRQWTIDTQVGMNFFFYTSDPTSKDYKTKKWSHWLIQPEVRYWTCDAFNGLFFGLHLHGGKANVGGINIPFILNKGDVHMPDYRYESYFYGAGLSIGYQWIISNRFNIEASIGAGYARINYDKFKCASCGDKVGDGHANYIGPTKASFSLIYVIK